MTSKSVNVLAPNGHRQTVKITPNTTILQVLEEVCRKHGYSPQRWDIKHFNQVLDASSIIRFIGLPNNAQLEMTPRKTDRASSNVTIGLQLENGQRLLGDFDSTTTLSQIINNLCPAQESDNTVIIYMHQEVHGKENLQTTTLQSLGLSNGRAMLRLLHRDLNKLNTQAHVSSELKSKPNKLNEKPQKNSKKKNASIPNQIKKAFDPLTMLRTEKNDSPKNIPQNKNKKDEEKKAQKKPSGPGHVLGRGESQASITSSIVSPVDDEAMKMDSSSHIDEAEEEIDFLGDRNALLFNQAGAKAIPREVLPDNFFDLTLDDAKALIHDAKRQREELEECPLTTRAQRELNRNKSILNKLHKYRKTIIRIQFPNQWVLQGIFGPLETVQMVKDFVKEYLADPNQEFVLYCTPPRKNLNPEKRLVDENLVPSAIIYYSGISELRSDLKSKLIDPQVALVQAIKSRMTLTRADTSINSGRNDNSESYEQIQESIMTSTNDPSTSTSTSETSGGFNTNRIKNYTPKWFQNAFK